MLEDADDLQSSRLDQAPEFSFGALSGSQTGHELPVETGQCPVGALVGQDELVQQDLGVALCQRRHELVQDVVAFGVAPVLHDGVEEVCSCAWGTKFGIVLAS
jgi:hypothetical protein